MVYDLYNVRRRSWIKQGVVLKDPPVKGKELLWNGEWYTVKTVSVCDDGNTTLVSLVEFC